MGLKVTVKASGITNLSDARYCAGMGVHMLGFGVVAGREGFIKPSVFQEMRGWFSGPQVVAEVYGLTSRTVLEQVILNYRPDLLEGGLEELPLLIPSDLPYLLYAGKTGPNEIRAILTGARPPLYVVIDTVRDSEYVQHVTELYPVLMKLPDEEPEPYLQLPVHGFVIQGSAEERPGFKSYEHLASVLEKLEEEGE
jgi:phosphoribosylanthranilate isomerase